ncbi:MAG: PASTA domain-containing protein, partial [Casimicrobiaceae bacterium]
ARQPFSRNMGAGPLRGGKIVSATPIDVLYFGAPGSVNLTGVNAIAFDTVKAANFWAFNGGARELPFLHIVFADFHDATGSGGDDNIAPFTGTVTSATANGFTDSNQNFTTSALGGGVKITGGTGAGQVRSITGLLLKSLDVTVPWNVMPDATSTYVIFDGSSGQGRAGERYDGSFSPGTSLAITLGTFPPLLPGNELGSFLDQWQTLAHEMGHLITLKHGGVDHNNFKAGYFSVMNYAYQLCATGLPTDGSGATISGTPPCPVASYAGLADPVFNDWENIDRKSALNFQRVGQAFGAEIDPPTSPFPPPRETETFKSRENRFGPPDLQAPAVNITSPSNGVVVVQGNTITVSFTATDSAGITKAEVFFDVNGDGVVNDATEVVTATPTGANTFSATVPALSGPSTARPLAVMAYDPTGNPGVATLTVQVGSARPPVVVPDVVNQPQPAATATIGALNLVVGTVTQQPSLTVPAGSIISQIPIAGGSVPVLTAIDLVLSSGNTTAIVPNGVGMTQANASSAMTAAGLTVGTATMLPSSTVPSGSVISQLPLAGSQVAAAATVTLRVSTGPGNVLVPDVTNLAVADAINIIGGTGLVVGTKTSQLSGTVPAGAVISQSPTAGMSIPAGSAVNLAVSSGAGTTQVPQLVGRTQAVATAALGDYGLVAGTITMQASATVPAGSVISQSPLAGVTVPFGSAVAFVVSTGPAPTLQRTAVSPKGSDANACSFTSPCRTFDRAISRTQSGGEVIVLASAGYGPMVIDRPITIAAPSGVYAGISVLSGTGIVVNPGSGGVALKGLAINGLGGTRGIDLQSGASLFIDDCTVSGFTQAGLYAQPSIAITIQVRHSAFRDNGTGISAGLAAAGLLQLNLDGAQFEGNGTGLSIAAFGAVGTLRGSAFVNNGTGLSVAPGASGASAQLEVSKTTFKGNGTGIVTGGVAGTTSKVNVSSSLVASSAVGLSSAAGGTIVVADTTITRNVTGLQQSAGGACVTFGNNRLVNNTTNGTFTSSSTLK